VSRKIRMSSATKTRIILTSGGSGKRLTATRD
jgi:hypothetical protein